MVNIFSRGAIYFDEVARRGSIRAAGAQLRIAPSAVNRQILELEQDLGVALFERLQTGLRPTAAGELLLGALRNWRRDFGRVIAQIDDLRGLKRGEVAVGLVEGAGQLLSQALVDFQRRFPAIIFHLRIDDAKSVVRMVLAGEAEIGLVFNPDSHAALRVERALIYQLGAVTLPDHTLALKGQTTLRECADSNLIVPDETMSIRLVIDKTWARSADGPLQYAYEANSVAAIKTLILNGLGVGLLTSLDVSAEIRGGALTYTPLNDSAVDLSVLSLVTASKRTLSAPASLALQYFSQAMLETEAPSV